MTKVAIGVGGVAILGGLAYVLLGKKTRTATPNPGRRRRRRKSPWCAAAVRACDGPMLKRRAKRNSRGMTKSEREDFKQFCRQAAEIERRERERAASGDPYYETCHVIAQAERERRGL